VINIRIKTPHLYELYNNPLNFVNGYFTVVSCFRHILIEQCKLTYTNPDLNQLTKIYYSCDQYKN